MFSYPTDNTTIFIYILFNSVDMNTTGGFSLELGLKDVSLVSQAAREVDTPMPFLSVLVDRFVSAKARGRGNFDWSAIGLSVGEDAGIDVKADVDRNRKAVENGDMYK
jgi:hypothetical protein